MFRTPDIYGYITANWRITHRLTATFSATGTRPQPLHSIWRGSGTDVDLAVRTSRFSTHRSNSLTISSFSTA